MTNVSINKIVGRYLKRKRIECDMTGTEISKLLHVSQQQVSRYERGLNNAPLGLVFLFIKKLDLDIEDFFIYLLKELEDEKELNSPSDQRAKNNLYFK